MSNPPHPDRQEDLSSGIFSRTDYSAAQAMPRDFKRWHLPRKQFVRREQWAAQTLRVFEGRSDDGPVAYLGLPGTDLLDLRYIHQKICVPLGRPLRFLGFNREAQGNHNAAVDLNTSLDEVTRLKSVDSQSDVITDDFRSLARQESIAWQRARRLGPFDVVNLDLCDGIASDDPETDASLYDAIAALMSLQVRSPNPWALLVTSRIGRDHFHENALGELLDRFNRNLSTCREFAEQCTELLGVDDASAIDPHTCPETVFLRMTLVALCKWLLGLGQAESANRVELASCQGYRVDQGASCEDLVSFALVFKPVIRHTATALRADRAPGIDECSEAARIARRAKNLLDVDTILAGDTALFEELAGETEVLLCAARYDPALYREWLETTPGERPA